MSGTEALELICFGVGASFILLAAVGAVRLPDLYTRMHAITKAGTAGLAGVLFGAMLHFRTLEAVTTGALIVLFFVMTFPVGAHLIGRAAYLRGTRQYEGTVIDELRHRYDRGRGLLSSEEPPDLGPDGPPKDE